MSESTTDRPSCCGPGDSPPPSCCDAQRGQSPPAPAEQIDAPWVEGAVPTPVGDVPQAATTLTQADRSGAWKVRWGRGAAGAGSVVVVEASLDTGAAGLSTCEPEDAHAATPKSNASTRVSSLSTSANVAPRAAGRGAFPSMGAPSCRRYQRVARRTRRIRWRKLRVRGARHRGSGWCGPGTASGRGRARTGRGTGRPWPR